MPERAPARAAKAMGSLPALKFCVLLLLLAGCSSTPSVEDIPNLKVVAAPAIYRGGQPASARGWRYLYYSLGVSNVVKLNLELEGNEPKALGMKVQNFPIDWEHQTLLKPSAETLAKAVGAITPGTFVHCERGQDRTGLVIAIFRRTQGWTKAEARREMITNGFHVVLHGLDDFWEDEVH